MSAKNKDKRAGKDPTAELVAASLIDTIGEAVKAPMSQEMARDVVRRVAVHCNTLADSITEDLGDED